MKDEENQENMNNNIQTMIERESLKRSDAESVRNESNNANYLPAVDFKMLKKNASLLRMNNEQGRLL